jgi:hypothetical protein
MTIPHCPVPPSGPVDRQHIFASRTGRPSSYSDDIAARICDAISDGALLATVCEAPDMPSKTTVHRWRNDRPDFRAAYARAREAWSEHYAELIVKISMDASNDFLWDKNGNPIGINYPNVQRATLAVNTFKWLVGKYAPRTYGESPEIAVEPARAVTSITRTIVDPAPVALPAPPLQLTFDPGPLPASLDSEILARMIAAVKKNVPKAKDVDPRTLLNEVIDVVDRALRIHYGTSEVANG